jgi:hypothetical protein
MTDNNTPGGAPGASPGGAPSDTAGSTRSYVAARTAQMAESMERQSAPGDEPAADAGQRQTPVAMADGMIAVGDLEYTAEEVRSAIAERAEAQSRKATLPASADAYEIKLPDNFQAPEGVKFEFNPKDPALKTLREIAHKRGLDQQTVSELLAVAASREMGAAIQQSQLRDVNMKQLGAAGPQRVEAVATWLQARAGAEGKQTADFLRRYRSAPIVKAMEALIRQFSNQGGADFSQSHRENMPEEGKIPGYEKMSFQQIRAAQMSQAAQRPGYRGGGRRGE